MIQEKWAIIQPVERGGYIQPLNSAWTNHSFKNVSQILQGALYHTTENIPLHFDAYYMVSYDIGLIGREIEIFNNIKKAGKKSFLTFSHDMRFLSGAYLYNQNGEIYTDLCAVADVIGSGVGTDLNIYGRYQNKVIPFGEFLFNNNFSKPFENRTIDLLISGSGSEESLSFGIEFLLMIKEKYPEKRVVCLIHTHFKDLIFTLRYKFPSIEFPFEDVTNLLDKMRDAKVYCNTELRPRPGRTLIEAYYCRVPFISSSLTYFSHICKEFTYDKISLTNWVDNYEKIINEDYNNLIVTMENRAGFDFFDTAYNRIRTTLF